ncbi:MAG: S8 family serine peptidase [Candidatus Sulfotelmatobacter sp.]
MLRHNDIGKSFHLRQIKWQHPSLVAPRAPRSFERVTAILVSLFVLMASNTLAGQTATPTDLRFHKFQPKVAPEQQVSGARNQAILPGGMSLAAAQQIQGLQQEKASRTPAQQKIDSNVLYTIRMLAGKPAAPGVPYLDTGVDLDDSNNIVTDMVANVTDSLLAQITAAGGQVLYANRDLRSIRASIPPEQIENLAASPEVIFISPKQGSMTAGSGVVAPISPMRFREVAPGFEQRAARVRQQLAKAMSSTGIPQIGQGSVETEGDFTHRAVDARGAFGVDGAGLTIGVLSDGVTSMALSQATGDLPPTCGTPPCLTVLSGQAGAGDEGTAMMEIIHDMAPGASLYFATADNSITSFAANIRALQAAGCNIIVDDVFYFVETPFQDGQTAAVVSTSQGGVVTQAVNDVVADSVLYFSAAGNEGNLDTSTSGTYEGDFVPQAATSPLPTGNVHNFGSGHGFDTITSPGEQVVGLFWSDPLGGSNNDYDLYVLNSTGTSVLAASTNIQNGTQDPVELIGSANVINNQIVVFQNTGALNRFFHLVLFLGELAVATSGETHGHAAASGAYTVAAAPAAVSAGPPTPNGPYPNPFTSSSQIEFFSSDGLRHIFFNADSSAITPGNFSSTGGDILNKPDITAADGVSVTGVGGFGSPFYGTSAAAPAAAAVAALVLSAEPTLSAAAMRSALTGTAVDIMASGFDRDFGNGIVMAWEAINSLGVTGLADPALGTITASENPGNGDGVIEAGEGASIVIALNNKGGVKAATGVTATLTTSTPNVYITQPATSAYADMPVGSAGGNNLSPFTFTLDPAFACGQSVDFTLTVNYAGGAARALNFTLPVGTFAITNTLGNQPPSAPGITTATGVQTNRINRNGVISACGTSKAFPGAITGSHTFDSYTFNACQSSCMTVGLNAGAAGINLFSSAYSPVYTPASIGTDYQGDAGLSTNIQSFGIEATASTSYTIVVNDVAGNPLPPPAPPNTYTIQIPACSINCNINQLPIAVAQNVSVIAASKGGTANANINNGSSDPDGDAITLTQTPAGPYPVGTTSVILTVVDTKGATAQATANVTVVNPGYTLAATTPAVSTTAGGSATEHITFTPSPGISGAVTLACSNLPAKSACSFTPSTLASGNAQANVVVTIATTASTAAAIAHPGMFYAAWLPFSGLGLVGMALMIPGKRRQASRMLTLLFLGLSIFAVGCGGGSSAPAPVPAYNGTPKGTYTVTVAGTSSNVTQSTTFSLTVN